MDNKSAASKSPISPTSPTRLTKSRRSSSISSPSESPDLSWLSKRDREFRSPKAHKLMWQAIESIKSKGAIDSKDAINLVQGFKRKDILVSPNGKGESDPISPESRSNLYKELFKNISTEKNQIESLKNILALEDEEFIEGDFFVSIIKDLGLSKHIFSISKYHNPQFYDFFQSEKKKLAQTDKLDPYKESYQLFHQVSFLRKCLSISDLPKDLERQLCFAVDLISKSVPDHVSSIIEFCETLNEFCKDQESFDQESFIAKIKSRKGDVKEEVKKIITLACLFSESFFSPENYKNAAKAIFSLKLEEVDVVKIVDAVARSSCIDTKVDEFKENFFKKCLEEKCLNPGFKHRVPSSAFRATSSATAKAFGSDKSECVLQ